MTVMNRVCPMCDSFGFNNYQNCAVCAVMARGTEKQAHAELVKPMTVFEVVDDVFIKHDIRANQQQAKCLLEYLAGMRTKSVVASDGLSPVVIIQLGRLAAGKGGN